MKIYKYTICVVMLAIGLAATGKPAKPGWMQRVQPDGSIVEYRLVGDEHGHVMLDCDGRVLVDDDGYLRVSQDDAKAALASIERQRHMRLSQIEAGRLARSRADNEHQGCYGLYSWCKFPSTGTPKGVAILVEYADVSFELDDPYDYFSRMLNEEGFSLWNGTGSARDYFIDNSCGQFVPEFDVYGPVTLSRNRSYYGANDSYGSDLRPHKMIIEACQLVDDMVDFSQYDCDGDGLIDNVYVYYAGMGEASGGPSTSVWPHSWTIEYAGETKKHIFDGVQLNHYACSNEWETDMPDGVGTFVHEFSHVMGLPDLYSVNGTGAFTPGEWSLMDGGSYNNDSRTPPNYSIFERSALGWLKPDTILEPMDCMLEAVHVSNKGYIITTERPTEYFLLENRQKEGWDAHIPGHGMLVWHIDYDEDAWYMNEANDDPNHQRVDLLEADNSKSPYSRKGDSYPGSTGKTTLTADTKPALVTWAGKAIEVPLTEIAERDGVVTFKAMGGSAGIKDCDRDCDRDYDYDDERLMYNLQGQPIKSPRPGQIYIQGHRVLRKN